MEMKSASKFLQDNATSDKFRVGVPTFTALQVTKLLTEYAEQAIDRCASKSFRKNIEVAGGNEIWEIVRKEEILKVKTELK